MIGSVMKQLEHRTTFDIELRADKDDESSGGFSGYAATFNRVDSYGTAFAPGSFEKTLKERGGRIPVLYNHNVNANVGVPETLAVDKAGLMVEARLFDDGAEGSVLLKRLRQGGIFGMSFGFKRINERKATEADKLDMKQILDADSLWDGVRVITEVQLFEVSVVSFPANEAAGITGVRNEAFADSLSEILAAVRDGTLTDDQRSLLDSVVAAYSAAPNAKSVTREPEIAQRRIDIDIALARFGHLRAA